MIKRLFLLSVLAVASVFAAPVNVQRVGGAGSDALDITTSLDIPTGKTITVEAGGVINTAAGTFTVNDLTTGIIRWNDTDKCIEWTTQGGTVIQGGQEITIFARNNTGGTLANGTPVYVTGATGNRPTIAKADADAQATAQTLIGLVTTDAGIPNNNDGFVTVFGSVRNLNTSSYSEGATLWLSDGTAGTLTATKPTSESSYVTKVGTVTNAHVTQGEILVTPHYHGSVTGDAVMNAVSKAAARTAIGADEQVKSANFTAVAGESYVITASATVTDPASPVNGQSYRVRVSAGTATIGSVGYSDSRAVYVRSYDSGAWSTHPLDNLTSIGDAEQTRILKTRRFSQKLAQIANGEDAVASLVITGDSYGAFVFENNVQKVLNAIRRYGYKGSWVGLGSNFAYGDYTVYGSASSTTGTSYSINTGHWVIDASGEGVGFNLSAQIRDWGYHAGKHTYVYGIGSGLGSIKFQTGAVVGGTLTWTDVATVSTANATTGTDTYDVTVPYGSVSRAIWVSGTNYIVGCYLQNTEADSGLSVAMLALGGVDLTGGANSVPQASIDPVIQLLAPDLVVQTYADADVSTAYPVMLARWQSALSTAEFIFVSPINGQPEDAGGGDVRRAEIIEFARANGQDYFDMRIAIPTYAFANARGWMGDTGHLNETGMAVASENFWRSFGSVFSAPLSDFAPREATTYQATHIEDERVFLNPFQMNMASAMEYQLDFNDCNKANSGSSSPPTFYPCFGDFFTGGTAGSETYLYSGGSLFLTSFITPDQINWSVSQGFSLTFDAYSTTANGIFRFVVGAEDKNSPTSAQNCMGIEVRGTRVWLITANGSTLTNKDTGYDIQVNKVTTFYLYSNGLGVASLWVPGVASPGSGGTPLPQGQKVADATGAPTTQSYAGSYGILCYLTNGADSATTIYGVRRFTKIKSN